ncbi:MAG: DUF4097 family beta strand repeat protein [Chthonomonadaceae bacterium]|nr:DUF4097 family beta strand repeat protein [Chthonomonadaceae bacterium]
MKLVQEGKLSPDDAAELIDAFSDSPNTRPNESTHEDSDGVKKGEKYEDHFGRFISSIEKIGKDVAKNVNWNDIAVQVRQGVNKGADAIKQAVDDAKKGGGFSLFFGSTQTKRVQLPLQVPEGKTLRIETRDGDIEIIGGQETGSLTIDASFRSYDEVEAKNQADTYTPVLEEGDHYVSFRQPEGTNVTTDVSIKIPAGVPVELKLTSGDVTVVDTVAPVKIEGSSGNVKIKNAKGAVQVSERSGSVCLEEVEATILSVETRSGDISVRDSGGVVELKTSSGNVALKKMRAKALSVEAASGNVDADLCQPVTGSVNVTAVTGNVHMGIVENCDCRVNLNTLRGTVASSVPLLDETIVEGRVTGQLGSGLGQLDVSVVTGNVSFEIRDSSAD